LPDGRLSPPVNTSAESGPLLSGLGLQPLLLLLQPALLLLQPLLLLLQPLLLLRPLMLLKLLLNLALLLLVLPLLLLLLAPLFLDLLIRSHLLCSFRSARLRCRFHVTWQR
jgi:hypothetical protein